MAQQTLILESPCDMHLHLRDGDMLKNVLPCSVKQFSAALIMPNLTPPLMHVDSTLAYQKRIQDCLGDKKDSFLPLMSLFFNENLDFAELKKAKENGIRILKLYPQGITTNSESGPKELLSPKNLQIFEAMQELGFILCVHGESNGFVLEREFEFLESFKQIAQRFPKLHLIFEHITDLRTIALIESLPNAFGTITLHHLLFTLDDLMGEKLKPHLFCKPCLKHPKDRDSLQQVALSANPKFCFGSDSAPHLKGDKECPYCAAGVFSAPVLLPALVEFFEAHAALENLQGFLSTNAQQIYGFTPPKRQIKLAKKPYVVQKEYGGVASLFGGEEMQWSLES